MPGHRPAPGLPSLQQPRLRRGLTLCTLSSSTSVTVPSSSRRTLTLPAGSSGVPTSGFSCVAEREAGERPRSGAARGRAGCGVGRGQGAKSNAGPSGAQPGTAPGACPAPGTAHPRRWKARAEGGELPSVNPSCCSSQTFSASYQTSLGACGEESGELGRSRRKTELN